jgi:hypothetical protein
MFLLQRLISSPGLPSASNCEEAATQRTRGLSAGETPDTDPAVTASTSAHHSADCCYGGHGGKPDSNGANSCSQTGNSQQHDLQACCQKSAIPPPATHLPTPPHDQATPLETASPLVASPSPRDADAVMGRVLFGTQRGGAAAFARQLVADGAKSGVTLEASDMQTYEVEQLWKERVLLVVVSTYEGGEPPEGARWFCRWLAEAMTDFRVGAEALATTRFSVFGCGNSDYIDHFNQVCKLTGREFCVKWGRERRRTRGVHMMCGVVFLTE